MYLTESHVMHNTHMHLTESHMHAFNRITRVCILTESHLTESHMYHTCIH